MTIAVPAGGLRRDGLVVRVPTLDDVDTLHRAFNDREILELGDFPFDPPSRRGVRQMVSETLPALRVIGVDSVPQRLQFARRMGADVVLNYKEQDVVAEIKRLTGGGADVTIEALGQQATFENALRSVRPSVNVVHMVGHGALRIAAMGFEARPAASDEVRAMERLLGDAMDAGAWGFSTGLVYPPSGYSETQELIALAQQKPGQLNFGSSGVGSGTHFGGELFKLAAKIDVTHVPYRGTSEALTETMSGRVQFYLTPVLPAMPLIKWMSRPDGTEE